MQSLDGDKIYLSSEEILEIKGELHEVAEGRLLELHQYVNVAGFLLLPTREGAEDAYSLDSKAGLDILDMAFEEICCFHVQSKLINGFMTLKHYSLRTSHKRPDLFLLAWPGGLSRVRALVLLGLRVFAGGGSSRGDQERTDFDDKHEP